MAAKSNWSNLPDDLLNLISNKLFFINDYIRFGGTCRSWHSMFSKNRDQLLPRQPPLLMIPTKPSQTLNHHHSLSFYSLFDKKVCNFQVSIPHNLHCCGSSFGWLLTVENRSLKSHLLNPFLSINNEIDLPCFNSLDIQDRTSRVLLPSDVRKAVLSVNPALTPNFQVMVIYGKDSRLGFFKSGDKIWTSIANRWHGFTDVIYYKGLFYAVNVRGRIVTFDISSPNLKVIKFPSLLPSKYTTKKMYVVEAFGEVLLAIREVDFIGDDRSCGYCSYKYGTVGFKVYKLDQILRKWIKVRNLCGFALFLGENSSMSLFALDFLGCKPNCIYFTDDSRESFSWDPQYGPHDMGVFNLENRSIKPLYPMESPRITPAPIWVEPTLQSTVFKFGSSNS